MAKGAPNGLWDPSAKRLTLFLHPGRIKRGVGPGRELGPVLQAGQTVRLRIEGTLESRRGVPLDESYERTLRVAEPDRESPNPDSWRVLAPRSRSGPVTLEFGERLDRALLLRFASVERAGERVPGTAAVGADGASWAFTPEAAWRPGRYRVSAAPQVEDLAGNTPGRLFDVETHGLPANDGEAPLFVPGEAGSRPIELWFDIPADSTNEPAAR
jgi:hypothetical protein